MKREESKDFVDGIDAVVSLLCDRKPIDEAVLARLIAVVEKGEANASDEVTEVYLETLRRLSAATDIEEQVRLADTFVLAMGKAAHDERRGRPPGEGASLGAQCVVAVSFGFNAVMGVAMGRDLPPNHARTIDDFEFALKVARAGIIRGYDVTDADVAAVGRLKVAAQKGDAAHARQIANEIVAAFPRNQGGSGPRRSKPRA